MSNSDIPGTESIITASMLSMVSGLWLIGSPVVLDFAAWPAVMGNALIVGLIVVALAWMRAAHPRRYVVLSWLNLLLGLWLMVSPFILASALRAAPTWNALVLGGIIAALSLWSALTKPVLPVLVKK